MKLGPPPQKKDIILMQFKGNTLGCHGANVLNIKLWILWHLNHYNKHEIKMIHIDWNTLV